MRRSVGVLAGGALGLVAWALGSSGVSVRAAQTQKQPPMRMVNPQVVYENNHDTSPPLREMKAIPPQWDERYDHRVRQWAHHHPLLSPDQLKLLRDGARQKLSIGPSLSATVGLNFDGVGLPSYTPSGAPPDTEGAIGATQYVQWVNTAFAVYNKTNGATALGPVNGNTLWQGFGTPQCANDNDGDPIVMWDQMASRWVMMQFAFDISGSNPVAPYFECIAVSTSADATGTWNRYAFNFNTDFPDYPKGGVWPDAYYVTYNIFPDSLGGFLGSEVCAMDRTSMLNGTAATQQCFGGSGGAGGGNGTANSSLNNRGGILPANLDGATLPPSGSREYILGFDESTLNALLLWTFHVDFATPSNSTLTGPTSLPVAAFTEVTCSGGARPTDCIPQPGTTQKVDSLGDRMMYRLAYRNFGDHEALVTNHAVMSGGVSGLRWYEVRNPGGTPTIFQQSTFQPDATWRWMGSIAQDHVGDMLLGYSASSSSVSPAVRITGRLATDALNTMQSESSVVTGGGSQNGGLDRWGDYSAMQIDPADDCTFWYTQEYLKSTGSFNWSTRIASYKFSSCTTTATPDFSVSASPNAVSVAQGGSGTSTITVASVNGFNAAVALSATGLPSGASAVFSPTSVTPPANSSGTSTLTLTTSSTTPTGTYAVTVTGTNGSTSHNTTVTLTVTAAPAFSVSASPTSLTINQGGSGTSTITVGSLNGFTSAVTLSASGLPNGVSASFSSNPVTPPSNGNATSTLTLTASSSATTGTATVTVTGTSGATTHSATITLTVNAPNFTTSASPSSVTVTQGGNGTSTITITSQNGFNSATTLSATGLPSGVTASFSANPVTPPSGGSASATLTLSASSTATTGTTTVTVTGTSGALTHSATISLTVNTAAAPNFTIGASPSSVTLTQGGNGTSTITITSQNSFSSATTLSASGLPNGVTASFSANPVTPPSGGSASSTLTLSASSTATTGTTTVTVTGTSGALTHSATISLTVNAGGGGAQTASFDSTLKAPKCGTVGISCDSGPTLLLGKDTMSGGAEPNQPNTINNSCADGTLGTFHSDESNDRIVVATTDGSTLAPGKTVKVSATVWAWSTGSSDALDLYYAANASSPTWTAIQTNIVPSAGGAQTISATYTLPSGGLQAVRANFRYQGSPSSCSSGSYDDHDDLIFAVGAGTPDYSVAASPSSLSVAQGSNGASTITLTSLNGFNSAVSLSASGLPSGVTASFSSNPVTPPSNGSAASTLTLTASSSATTGTATVTVTGTSGSTTHNATISLTITSPGGGPQTAVYDPTLKVPKCATVGSSCDSGPTLLLGKDTMSGGAEPHQPNTINNSCADGTSGTFHSDESNDRILVSTTDGSSLAHGKTVTLSATVWAWNDGSSDAVDLYYAANANSPTWVFITTIVPPAGGAQTLSATFTLPTGSLQAVRANFRYLGSASSCSTGSYDDHDDLVFAVN
jgi:uncharacterized membrane protein